MTMCDWERSSAIRKAFCGGAKRASGCVAVARPGSRSETGSSATASPEPCDETTGRSWTEIRLYSVGKRPSAQPANRPLITSTDRMSKKEKRPDNADRRNTLTISPPCGSYQSRHAAADYDETCRPIVSHTECDGYHASGKNRSNPDRAGGFFRTKRLPTRPLLLFEDHHRAHNAQCHRISTRLLKTKKRPQNQKKATSSSPVPVPCSGVVHHAGGLERRDQPKKINCESNVKTPRIR